MTRLYTLLTLLTIFFFAMDVEAKRTTCRARFKDNKFDYCTKFGAPSNSHVKVTFRSRLLNHTAFKPVEKNDFDRKKAAFIEFGVYSDQKWDELQALSSPTCNKRRELASQIHTVGVPVDGTWSDEFDHPNVKSEAILNSGNRPHIFYYALLDCSKSFEKTFKKGSLPRVLTEVVSLNQTPDDNHFSYEDMGLLSLHCWLAVLMIVLFGLMSKQYFAYYKDFDRLMSPHPIMLYALGSQLLALLFQTVHLWYYSSDGEGFMVLDVLSKIVGGLSEVAMSLLLILLGTGWTMTYQNLDLDDGLEIYLPMTALVVMVQIIVAALTFVDIDASHKYHDYAGIQGWVLFFLKLIIYAYYLWCIYETKKKADKKQVIYLETLFKLSSSYLLAVPLTILICFMFDPCERQYMFTFFSQSFMFVASLTLFYQLSNKKSAYQRASIDHQGLPGFEHKE